MTSTVPVTARSAGHRLPDFPWDSLADARRRADAHPDGLVDLSVGTPVDPVPASIRAALADEPAQAPGYPTTWGTAELRESARAALDRRYGVTGLDPGAVLPTIGSKELVAWLPTLLGLGPGDAVVLPELAYPTYEVGARLAGAEPVRSDDPEALDRALLRSRPVRLVWVNSPSNPTGRVLGADRLRALVGWARERGAVLASDECYLGLATPGTGTGTGGGGEAVSVLHPTVAGAGFGGLLAVHSLSKSSNLAGYRAGFVAGDPDLVARLLEVRKHAGMIVPRPVQAAMVAALDDDGHVHAQRARYQARRHRLRAALEAFGLRIEHSRSGLYLWATAGEPGRATVDRLAERGVLVAPGEFYGPAGARYVRVALTAPDDRIAAVAARLAPTASGPAVSGPDPAAGRPGPGR